LKKSKEIKTKKIRYLKYTSSSKLFSSNENNLKNFRFFYEHLFENKILVIDCGLKKNILRKLSSINSYIVVLNFNFKIEVLKQIKPNGIVISNGPGDPKIYKKLIKKKN